MNYLFVYNKKAGKKFEPSVVSQVESKLPKNTDYHFVEIQNLKKLKEKKKFDVFVAIGGDGTVNTVAKLAAKHDKILAVIPRGSGDGLARFLAIPRFIGSAVEVLLQHNVLLIDTAYLSGHFFINVAGSGFEAEVAHQFGKAGIRGLMGYISTTAKIFKQHTERVVKMKVDGVKYSVEYFSLSVANGSQWGNNFEIASKADIQDGLLDVAIMKKPKWYQIPSLITYLKTKQQKNNSLFTYYKASEIDIKQSGKVWHIDGEPILLKKKKEIRLVPQSLKVIVPK